MHKKPLITTASFPPVRVSFHFDSDSPNDRAFCEMLDRQLAPLKQNGWICTWDDRQILPGQEQEQEREHHLATDHLLILLISPDFLASEACWHQMDIALQRHASGDVTVLPLLVRPCLWEHTALRTLRILPREQHALGAQPSPEALNTIATELYQTIRSLQQRAFVAYAPEESDFVERLHRDLALSSTRLWSPERAQLTPDLSQNKQVQDAMRDASVVLLIASPTSIYSSAVKAQMALAAAYHHPVVIVWASGEDRELSVPGAWQADAVIDARADRYEKACAEIVAQVKEQASIIFVSQSSPKNVSLPTEPRNPYKGLEPFTAKDMRDFFGRETLISQLISQLREILTQEKKGEPPTHLLTVLGASGAGKSSVVMAGLLPRLQQGDIPGSQEWIYLDRMVPTTRPLEALAITLARHPSLGSAPSLHHALHADSLRTLHLLASQLVRSPSQKVVLFIDQFEEVFASAVSQEERQRFFDLLIAAVTDPEGPLVIVLTLRADFYDRPMKYSELFQVLKTRIVTVLPMQREDLRRAIERPVALPEVRIDFEDGLVGDLLIEVGELDAPLPLLQFTLEQLFTFEQRSGWRQGRLLTRQAYVALGGVRGALVKQANETYAALPSEEHRALAEFLFTRLIEPGTGLQDTARRRVRSEEFELADSRQTQLLQETKDAFIAARLLTANTVVETTRAEVSSNNEGVSMANAEEHAINKGVGPTTVEISHEALIRVWPLYASWIENMRENQAFQQTLSKDVEQWRKLGEPRDRLYRGSQLKTIKKWVNPHLLSKQQQRFLQASTSQQRWHWLRMMALLLVPVLVLGLVLTPLLVFRPSWCPSWLCLAPRALLAKGGAHDSNVQLTFQTLQSSIKVLTADPSTYTLANLPSNPPMDAQGNSTLGNGPTTGDAQLLYSSQTYPYRVVLKIHSLQQGRYGLVIDQVALLINQEAPVIPYPLRVVLRNDVPTYNNNLYYVTYRGQKPGALLVALYAAQPEFVSLLPGETDEISLEVRSTVVADLHFQVQVTYHVIGELATHSLTLPNRFEIIFSDPTNWHPYQIQAGHLVAAS